MRPFDELGEGGIFKAELIAGDPRDELRTRRALRIKELLTRSVGKEVLLVFFGKERRLVMIEPPGQPVVRTILEIDDRILVTIELFSIECITRAMHRRRVEDARVRIDLRAIKLGKYRARRDSVETIAVIKYP